MPLFPFNCAPYRLIGHHGVFMVPCARPAIAASMAYSFLFHVLAVNVFMYSTTCGIPQEPHFSVPGLFCAGVAGFLDIDFKWSADDDLPTLRPSGRQSAVDEVGCEMCMEGYWWQSTRSFTILEHTPVKLYNDRDH